MASAHSRNSAGRRHDLVEHLETVAALARESAAKFGGGELAYWAGMWHDLGKFHPDFQAYLRDCEQAPKASRRGPDHKRAGTSLALQHLQPVALLIKGHHGGLPAQQEVGAWVAEPAYQAAITIALDQARATLGDRLEPPVAPTFPAAVTEREGAEFFLRMLFSALVDADCLDTEHHFNPERSRERIGAPTLNELWQRLEADQARRFGGAPDTPVNRVRREVYDACLAAAASPPGFFRLTVPTGGGKTRSGLAFALRHALAHGLDRVIVAIPYTSIIEQTAQVYRDIVGDERAVLEHHSAVVGREGQEDAPVTPAWERLATENWDAPIVVTTQVQLFEGLLGERTGACRKLHNIARSVLILDEAQTLPPHLLTPTLDVLRQLVAHYGVSIVLCTATQPALDETPVFRGLPNVREIVPDPARHFAALERVAYTWPAPGERWSWARVAAEMGAADQVMTITNTKPDALALLDALADPAALHLSTLLCGAHRREVLPEVRRRLKAGEPCRLVATQVVEAGVDLDFPLVLRALGPLDRIIQAAGRCNREGLLPDKGRVVVFEPAEGHRLPPGGYSIGTDKTRVLLRASAGTLNLHDPAVSVDYFRRFYGSVNLDEKQVQAYRKTLDYPKVAQRYRLIDDDTEPLVVRYHRDVVDALVDELRAAPQRGRAILRRLQPYLVSVRSRALAAFVKEGLAQEVVPGLMAWYGKYDQVRGLGGGEADRRALVVTE